MVTWVSDFNYRKLPLVKGPSLLAAFFLIYATPSWGQGLLWSVDVLSVRRAVQEQGREVLVLVLDHGDDPYLGPTAEVGQIVVAWAARAYLPLRSRQPELLTQAGFRWRSPVPKSPALIIFNPLLEERGRLEGSPASALHLREFLRTWTTAPLTSVAPSQLFRAEATFQGNGEGLWMIKGGFFWEWGQSGPYLLLQNEHGAMIALPLSGGWAYRRNHQGAVWERAFFGVFE